MIHFDRQQSTRRSENAWSPQPPSPTRAANSVMTLAPDDFMPAERLDPDHDISSITWYPFDWTTGGPSSTYSPLRKSFVVHLAITSSCSCLHPSPCCATICVVSTTTNCIYGLFRFTRQLDYLNPLVAYYLLIYYLDSPVNRAQARNPFGKRHSQQLVASENNVDVGAYFGSSPSSPMFTRMMSPLDFPALPPSVSPSASLVSLSPTAVPLPSPGPDETTELDSVN